MKSRKKALVTAFKIFFAVLLSMSLLAGLVSCSKSGSSSSDPAESSGSTNTNYYEPGNESDDNPDSTDIDSTSTDYTGGSTQNGINNPTGRYSTTAANTGTQVINNCYVTGKKIAKDTVTLKIMIRDNSFGNLDYNKTDLVKYVKENFNINVDFEMVAPDKVVEKATAALASGKLPDVFAGMAGGYNTFVSYIETKSFIELGQYLDKFGPNIKKMFNEVPETVYASTHDDGKTYMLPMYSVEDSLSFLFFINKTWLSNLGLKMPTTTEEFYNVLLAFRDRDPNKNGIKDEIPLCIPISDKYINKIPNSLFSPFGVYAYNDGYCIDQSTGKVSCLYLSEGYRKGLRFYKKLIESSILPQDWKSYTSERIKNGTSSSVQTIGAFAARSLFDAVTKESFLANYTLLPPLTDDPSRQGNWVNSSYDTMYAEWYLVTKNCKYPEIAIRFADWMYSTEGSLSLLVGTPGDNSVWKYDANGKIVKNNGKGTTTPGYALPHYYSSEVWKLREDLLSSRFSAAEKAYQEQLKNMYLSRPRVKTMPHLYTNKREREAIANANISNPFQKGDEYTFKFISGARSIDNDWNSFLNDLNKLGLNELLKIAQQQYDRYNVYMKKAKN